MAQVSWYVAHKAGAAVDVSVNLDMGDPLLRDAQMVGALAEARLASAVSEDVWAVSLVTGSGVTEVSRYQGGQRVAPVKPPARLHSAPRCAGCGRDGHRGLPGEVYAGHAYQVTA